MKASFFEIHAGLFENMQNFLARYQNQLPQIGLAILLNFVLFIEIVVSGFSSFLQIQQSPYLSFLFSIFASTVLTLWVHYDSLSLGISMGLDQAMYIFWGWPIMFPVYAFKSRGFRSGSFLLLLFLGLFIFTLAAAFEVVLIAGIFVTLTMW
jgi:hypothetical protein